MRKTLIGLLVAGTVLTGCVREDPLDNPCSSESIELAPGNYALHECGGPTDPDGNFYPDEEDVEVEEHEESYN